VLARTLRRSGAARPFLVTLLLAPGAGFPAETTDDGPVESVVSQEIAFGGMVRVRGRDYGLIGGGNGGTGTSVNYDDGNLNYGRGLTSLAAQGRTTVESRSNTAELRVDAVYFYDAVAGETDFRPLSEEARERAVGNVYLNEAFVGVKGAAWDSALGARLGNQILRWSESPSFGYSIAPVNPVSASRRYQPGNTGRDSYAALPMLTAKLESADKWTLQGFYLFGFRPTELEASGTFLSGNDYYSPGGRFLQLGNVTDTDASVVVPGTDARFGSKVSRDPDRTPSGRGQFGARIATPEMGEAKLALSGYAMRVHSREPVVSVRTGTLGGLLGTTAPDYTSSGAYFVEYVPDVTVLGTSAKLTPWAYSRLNFDYSLRMKQPLQIDDDILVTAGLAPAAATAACAGGPTPQCTGTLAMLNQNPLIAARGGITAANASSFFATEISGYERFNVSQYAVSMAQGLPPVLGAASGSLAIEAGGVYIHGFKDRFLDASVSVRPDANGARRLGFATRSSWGYRISARLDYSNVAGMQTLSPSVTWIHDPQGNAPITLGTLLEGTMSAIAAVDCAIDKSTAARLSYRTYLGKGNNADRYSDRDFVALSLTKRF
jgi:hypothetical protein